MNEEILAREPLLVRDPLLDEVRPWERQPWEGDAPFSYFHNYYLTQSVPRNLVGGYRQWFKDEYGLSQKDAQDEGLGDHAHWRKYATGWVQDGDGNWTRPDGYLTWEERARAFDDYSAALDRAMWMERQQRLRERDWNEGEQLRDLAMAVLNEGGQFIKSTRRFLPGEDGQPDQVIVTVALDATAAANIMKLGRDSMRLAADMSTSNVASRQVTISADLFAQVGESVAGQARKGAIEAADQWLLEVSAEATDETSDPGEAGGDPDPADG